MPPLTGGDRSLRRKRPGHCIDEHFFSGRSRSSESVCSAQGSGRAASLVPHSWRKHVSSIPGMPQASPEMLDEPIGSSLQSGGVSE
jgi:hypothetical protein